MKPYLLSLGAGRADRQAALRRGAGAIYLQPLAPLAPAGRDQPKKVGGAAHLDGKWQVNRNLKLHAQLVHQPAGRAIRALGGKPVDLAVLFAQLRF